MVLYALHLKAKVHLSLLSPPKCACFYEISKKRHKVYDNSAYDWNMQVQINPLQTRKVLGSWILVDQL